MATIWGLFRRGREAMAKLQNKGKCNSAETVFFMPGCTVINPQNRSAISIADGSAIAGQLLVYPNCGTIRIGKRCFIGSGSRIWSADNIEIGNNVLISHNVNIHDNNSHSHSAAERRAHFLNIFSNIREKPLPDVPRSAIVISDDAWIGCNAIILKGVHIGRGAVVAAGAIVTRDVDEFTIVAGHDCRIIGRSRS